MYTHAAHMMPNNGTCSTVTQYRLYIDYIYIYIYDSVVRLPNSDLVGYVHHHHTYGDTMLHMWLHGVLTLHANGATNYYMREVQSIIHSPFFIPWGVAC